MDEDSHHQHGRRQPHRRRRLRDAALPDRLRDRRDRRNGHRDRARALEPGDDRALDRARVRVRLRAHQPTRCCAPGSRSPRWCRSRSRRTRSSIATMEVVDNAIVLLVPGAMDAGLGDLLFWGSLAFALAIAGVVAVPVNRWLIARGKGHAVVHETGIHGGPPIPVVATIAVLAFLFGSIVLGAEALELGAAIGTTAPAACGRSARGSRRAARARARAAARAASPARRAPRAARGASPRTRAARAANARWRPAFSRAGVEAVGLREDRRVAVGGGDRDPHQLAGRDLAPRRARCRASRSGRSPPRRARAAATPPPPPAAPVARHRLRPARAAARWRSSPRSSRCRRTAARRRSTAPPRALSPRGVEVAPPRRAPPPPAPPPAPPAAPR